MVFFFFQQNTAYELRISDWSSDVCSSDLFFPQPQQHPVAASVGEALLDQFLRARLGGGRIAADAAIVLLLVVLVELQFARELDDDLIGEIGRASCRERVCPYV